MFSHARYVVVDDEKDELDRLLGVLHSLKAPCIGMQYDPVEGIKKRSLEGVRLLFMDLHLLGSGTGSKTKSYAAIAGIVEDSIVPESGPYVLILWTKHAQERDEFSDYIFTNVDPQKRPLAILSLDKTKYVGGGGNANLANDVEAAIATDARLKAFLSWERHVLSAAGATLAELGQLIPDGDKVVSKYSDRLDGILSVLAVAAVGEKNASDDPRAAVSSALSPILADKIVNHSSTNEEKESWRKAVTKTTKAEMPKLEPEQAARMNTVVHLSLPAAGSIAPHEWGAVLELPEDIESFSKAFLGLAYADLAADMFRVAPEEITKGKLCLIRGGAQCDYAQGKSGPLGFTLGWISPTKVKYLENRGKKTDAEFDSVPLSVPDLMDVALLRTNARAQISLTRDAIKDYKVLFRIRAPLLTKILTHNANYSNRPGALEFH